VIGGWTAAKAITGRTPVLSRPTNGRIVSINLAGAAAVTPRLAGHRHGE